MPRVHLVQLDIAWEQPAENHERVRQLLDRMHVEPGDFVLLPEMFSTGFSFNIETTHDRDGSTYAFLVELASEFRVCVQGGRTLAACHGCAAKNVMTAVGYSQPQPKVLGEFTKMHPFRKECERFEKGDDVVTYPWEAGGLVVCPAICYDLRFPELFRLGMLKGAEMFAIGACWPSVRHAHWRALLIARAIENQAFVLGCNRAGDDPPAPAREGLHYAGGSMVVSPMGEVLGELGEDAGVLSVEISAVEVRAWREKFPAWKDVRLMKKG